MAVDKLFDRRLSLTGVYALDNKKFSQSDLVDSHSKDIVKLGVIFGVTVLLLNTDLTVIIVLAGKQQMVGWLDL